MKSVQARIQTILDNTTGQDLNSWKKEFLKSLKERGTVRLSKRQTACLRKTEAEDESYRPLDGSFSF